MSNKEQQVIETVNRITALEGQLAAARESLRLLLGTSPATIKPKKQPATRVTRNVSAEVLAYVLANPGQRVPHIITALGLKKREGTVRAALKKYQQQGRLANYQGHWIEPSQTQKAPEVIPQGPNGVVVYPGGNPGA